MVDFTAETFAWLNLTEMVGLEKVKRRLIEYLMIRSGFHRIRRRLVDRIAADDADWLARYEWMSDGNNTWRVFDRHGLFGVKRIARRPDHPLRRYIDALAPAPGPVQEPEPTSHKPPVAP